MIGNRQHRKRVELILMVFIGLAWGILLSELMPRTRWPGGIRNNQGIDEGATSRFFPSSGRSSLYFTPPPPSSSLTSTPITTTEDSAAARLFNETRVLCLVLTSPKTHQSRAVHVQRTWGTRCHKLIFMSTKADKELGAVALNVREGYSNLWGKTRASLQYVYQHHFRNYDWFLKADDDTYVVMENLRGFLYAYSPKSPVYFGSQIGQHINKSNKSGGDVFVLSKAALHKFMKSAFDNSSICSNLNIGYEYVELGRCLKSVGVTARDSHDEQGLTRFIPFSPLHWYKNHSNYTTENDTSDCCSNSAIFFRSGNAREFYVLDYIIYKLKSFGINNVQEYLPPKKSNIDGTRHSFQQEKITPGKLRLHPGKSLGYFLAQDKLVEFPDGLEMSASESSPPLVRVLLNTPAEEGPIVLSTPNLDPKGISLDNRNVSQLHSITGVQGEVKINGNKELTPREILENQSWNPSVMAAEPGHGAYRNHAYDNDFSEA